MINIHTLSQIINEGVEPGWVSVDLLTNAERSYSRHFVKYKYTHKFRKQEKIVKKYFNWPLVSEPMNEEKTYNINDKINYRESTPVIIDIDPEAPRINLNRKETYLVKLPNNQYGAKNSTESIQKTGVRYVATTIRAPFSSAVLANECARFFQSKGIKAAVEKVEFSEE